jgi:hypothetical protein
MARNADTIRSLYERFNKGDVEGVLAALDANIEWQLPDSLPFGGIYRGIKEVKRFFTSLPEYFSELRVEAEEFLEVGSKVVALGRHRGKAAKGSFEVPFAMVWELRAGKPVRFQEYQDTASTLKAIDG